MVDADPTQGHTITINQKSDGNRGRDPGRGGIRAQDALPVNGQSERTMRESLSQS